MSNFEKRLLAVQNYNAQNRWTKQGIAMVPVKFGVGWQYDNQACQVNIFGDGSIQIIPSGVELGQGLNTKVAQGVAYALGLSNISLITVGATGTKACPNVSPTGGSVTSALCVQAALNACQVINQRLAPVRTTLGTSATWEQIIAKAVSMGIQLSEYGWVNPGAPPLGVNQYNSYSAVVTQLQIDVLTGEVEVQFCDILYDCGITLSALVDIGQIEGAFVFGLGYYLTEQIMYDTVLGSPTYGTLITDSTWEYKPPSALDIPIQLNVTLLKDAPNPLGVMSSKCTGEPPLALGCSALFAVQHAVQSVKSDLGSTAYFEMNAPATVENTALVSGLTVANLTLS